MRFTVRIAVALIALLALPLTAFGQTTGNLFGVATDGTGATLPGVTVTVTSPNLQGSRSAVTSASGEYQLQLLPPGNYRVEFTARRVRHDREGERPRQSQHDHETGCGDGSRCRDRGDHGDGGSRRRRPDADHRAAELRHAAPEVRDDRRRRPFVPDGSAAGARRCRRRQPAGCRRESRSEQLHARRREHDRPRHAHLRLESSVRRHPGDLDSDARQGRRVRPRHRRCRQRRHQVRRQRVLRNARRPLAQRRARRVRRSLRSG